jgi:hypothetical protein
MYSTPEIYSHISWRFPMSSALCLPPSSYALSTLYTRYIYLFGGGGQGLALRDVAEDGLLKSFIKPIQSI